MKAFFLVSDGQTSQFELRDVSVPEPGAGEVLVAMRASSMNRGEFLTAGSAGARPAGSEGAGEVATLGPGVTNFQVGQRIMARCKGGFAELAVVDACEAMPVPDHLSWLEAGAIPIAFLVAYDMLFSHGRVQPGQWLLITGISSGVGVASLQIAKALGAHVIGTSSSASKLVRLTSLGLDTAILTGRDDIVASVMEATGGKGVDLAINAVGGSLFKVCQKVLAYQGRLATVGTVDGVLTSAIDIAALHARRQVLYGVSNRLRSADERSGTVRGFRAEVLPRLTEGRIAPFIDRVFSFENLPDARAYMESNAHVGKIAISIP